MSKRKRRWRWVTVESYHAGSWRNPWVKIWALHPEMSSYVCVEEATFASLFGIHVEPGRHLKIEFSAKHARTGDGLWVTKDCDESVYVEVWEDKPHKNNISGTWLFDGGKYSCLTNMCVGGFEDYFGITIDPLVAHKIKFSAKVIKKTRKRVSA